MYIHFLIQMNIMYSKLIFCAYSLIRLSLKSSFHHQTLVLFNLNTKSPILMRNWAEWFQDIYFEYDKNTNELPDDETESKKMLYIEVASPVYTIQIFKI